MKEIKVEKLIEVRGNKGANYIKFGNILHSENLVYLEIGDCCVVTFKGIITAEMLSNYFTQVSLNANKPLHSVIAESLAWDSDFIEQYTKDAQELKGYVYVNEVGDSLQKKIDTLQSAKYEFNEALDHIFDSGANHIRVSEAMITNLKITTRGFGGTFLEDWQEKEIEETVKSMFDAFVCDPIPLPFLGYFYIMIDKVFNI